MAELTVNGQPAGVSFWPPHKFPLAGLLIPGENTLTLTLTGSPANRYGKHPVPYGRERYIAFIQQEVLLCLSVHPNPLT